VHEVGVTANARQLGNTMLGNATISLAKGTHSLMRATGPQRQGSFTLRSSGKTLLLRPDAYRLSVDLSRAVARFAVRVARSDLGSCPTGTRGSLIVVDPGFAAVKIKPTLRIQLPKSCSIGGTAWQSSTISVRPLAK